VAPHLTWDQASEIIETANLFPVNFVGPPLMVHGALHVMQVNASTTPEGIVDCVNLTYLHATRRKVSYVESKPKMAQTTYPYEEEAEEYASLHWPKKMCWDCSKAVLAGHVINPEMRKPDPLFAHTFIAWLNQPYPELLAGWEPRGELIDDAIMAYAWFGPAAAELLGHHKAVGAYYCDACGGGIGERYCDCCRREFKPATGRRVLWDSAIPRSIDMPSTLQIDRRKAWLHDYEAWLMAARLEVERGQVSKPETRRVIDIDYESGKTDSS